MKNIDGTQTLTAMHSFHQHLLDTYFVSGPVAVYIEADGAQ